LSNLSILSVGFDFIFRICFSRKLKT